MKNKERRTSAETNQRNLRPGGTTVELSLDELRERKTLTATITANLRVIREDFNDLEDLQSLERQTTKIVANLRTIGEDQNDLDELERRSGEIVGNLGSIQKP
jgi:hypothetical protein